MAEWLGDTPIFQATMTDEEYTEFALFKTKVKAIDTKETDMAKKNDVQTIATANESKEDTTMTENAAKKPARLPREEWKAQYIAGLKAKAEELAKKHQGEELPQPVNLFHNLNAERTGEATKPLYASELEARVLALTCLENGWTAEYITANQAKRYGGEPAEGAVGVKLYGKDVARGYTYFNAAEIVWAEGEPVYLDDVAKELDAAYAQRDAERKANKAQRRANELAKAAGMKPAKRRTKRSTKTSRKPAAKKVETIANEPVPMAAPAGLIHIKLANGVEFDARDAKEAAELKALFE